jgi:hypothetical protein
MIRIGGRGDFCTGGMLLRNESNGFSGGVSRSVSARGRNWDSARARNGCNRRGTCVSRSGGVQAGVIEESMIDLRSADEQGFGNSFEDRTVIEPFSAHFLPPNPDFGNDPPSPHNRCFPFIMRITISRKNRQSSHNPQVGPATFR